MCGKAGKIITTPKAVRVIHSASTLSVDSRSHYRYLLKLAMRRAVDDMVEILEGGDPKSAAFLRSELLRLDAVRGKNGTARSEEPKDGGSEAAEDSGEADVVMGLDGGLWG